MRRMTNLGAFSLEERDTAFDDWLPGDQDDEWPNGPAIGPPKRLMDVVPRPMAFTVDGLMLAGDLTAFVGEGDAGKSTLLYHLAAAIASGHHAFEQFRVPRSGNVLLLSGGEDDAELMRNRISSMCLAHGWPESEVLTRVHVYDEGIDLDSDQWERRITKELKALQAVAFFCDPLADLLGSKASENSNDDARRITRSLRRIIRASGAACGIAHHAAKPTETKSDKTHRVRGASAWANACRLVWWVAKWSGGMSLEPVKANRLGNRSTHRILRTVLTQEDGLAWRSCHLSVDTAASSAPDNDTVVLLRVLRDAQNPPNVRALRALLREVSLGTDRARAAMNNAESHGWARITNGKNRAKTWDLSEVGRAHLLASEGM